MSEHILAALRAYRALNVFNPWADSDPLDLPGAAARRRGRMRKHFDVTPSFLLVGEAPGYKGCRFSGVPFTDEAMLCAGAVPRLGRCRRTTARGEPWAEGSASAVWAALRQAGIAERVVMWNAFAFHAHKEGRPLSNRKPTAGELRSASGILRMVIDHFEGAAVVAVGNVAAEALRKAGVSCQATLRHPARGGGPEFRAGLVELAMAAEA